MRLIDADALKEYVFLQKIRQFTGCTIADAMKMMIDEQPTVDAVPVIRCKDCRFWMQNPYREPSVFGLCFKHKDIAVASDETDWCSWAERKEE